MPSNYYHLKFELYATPDPTASGDNETDHTREGDSQCSENNIWVPSPGATVFDDLPSHRRGLPRQSTTTRTAAALTSWPAGFDGSYDGAASIRTATAANYYPTKIIDCGAQRGKAHASHGGSGGGGGGGSNGGGNIVRLSERQFRARERRGSSPPPKVADGIGPRTAVRDWRFGRIRIESFDLIDRKDQKEEEQQLELSRSMGKMGVKEDATPAVSLGPSLGGMGQATKARYLPLETKNTEAGWGIVHLYREGDETNALRGLSDWRDDGDGDDDDGGEGNSRGVERVPEDEQGTILCIPAVPSYMSPSDFLGFVGERWRGGVSHYRMIMTSRMSRYMVLMKFRDRRSAMEWRKEFDGKPFDSVETEICHVTFIKSITVETPSRSSIQRKTSEGNNGRFSPTSSSVVSSLKPFPPPTPNLIELPTCAVCLERMDDTTGLMTILCQHVFHCTCLQTWKGSGCPVCRATNPKPNSDAYDPENPYSQPFGSGVANICNNCNCTDDLWICLICGNVGCGRYNGGHAKEHWKMTAHSFSLELQTQHVWDYAGDMWVHRLIRDKGDGKVVELPRNTSNDRQADGGGGGGDGAGQEDVVPRAKLDRIGMEYTHLLTSQLESQRIYFEEMVNKAADKAAKAAAAAESASAQANEALKQLTALREEHRILKEETVPSLERELARERNRATKSAELARNMGKALQEEKEVTAGLMKRIEHLNGEAASMGNTMEQLKAENEELKEMNRDLTIFISGQEKLKEMEKEGMIEHGELEDGLVGVAEGGSKRKGKGKAKK
ncbi:RING finger protein ETP1 [Madurella fahalii]|uniref:RING finger protein ETP1 n=1 Tax=Madurella fahalii TaxID=1157608 RepID=A0ABQ0GDR0_9PEZI